MSLAFKNLNLETKISLIILATIGLQQFPVIRVGGSFKIYELMAMGLLIVNLFAISKARFVSLLKLYAFGFFVLSPLLSLVFSYIFLNYPSGFFSAYKDTDSFKFNYYIFPALQLVYMFFNYAAINSIIKSERLYQSFDKLLRIFIWIATIIAVYSIYAMFGTDFISKLPEFIQNKHEFFYRSVGLSQEPSFYVLYQSWIVLFIFYAKNSFSKNSWWILMFINVLSLLFTFSTTLLALLIIVFASFFIFKNPLKTKIWIIIGLLAAIVIGYLIILSTNNLDYLEAYFYNKIINFFSAPEHTLDSGSFRSYTSRIGIEIFKAHPITGVGVGNSQYYMYLYEGKMGIRVFGETLIPGVFPQNSFSIVLSEQGLLGGIFFILMLYKMLVQFWKFRNYDGFTKMFFIGFLFNVSTLLTIAPVYSLFLWVFPALGLGYIRNINRSTLNEQLDANNL
jgi:O-antigen ligase